MTATNATSAAILKRKYKDGVPKLQFTKALFVSTSDNRTDWVGDDFQIALQTAAPQGLGYDVATAQASLAPSKYDAFRITRKEYFGVARVTGQALRTATTQGGGALVDLWTREIDSLTGQFAIELEIGAFGNGSGVRGQIASGQGTNTLQLTVPTDVAKFEVGMRVVGVSDATLSPTVRAAGTSALITGINRATGTLTTSGNWTTVITGLAAGDYLVRAGDQASGGVANIPSGLKQWCVGGATPGTHAGLNRNVDPVRLAGQVYDGAGVPIEQAVMEMDSRLTLQGQANELILWVNPADHTNLKKSLTAKSIYERAEVQSKIADVSFKAIQFEGDYNTIKVLPNVFVAKGESFLVNMKSMHLCSAGAAPMILDMDSNEFLRVSTADAYEVRVGMYGDWGCSNPLSNIRGINFGA